MKSSGSRKLAQRYVDALFAVAKGASALGLVESDLRQLAALAEKDAAFAGFLSNPLLSRGQSAAALEAALSRAGAHEVTRKFMAMLSRNKRLPLLPLVAELFAQAAEAARGEMSAEMIGARALSDGDVAAAKATLAKAYGKKVNLAVRVSPELLGGVVVKVQSLQLDGSVAGKLERLKNKLKVA